MFDIDTEILVIYLAFISSDPILQYIISMYNVKFTKFHETVGYVRGGSLDDFWLPPGAAQNRVLTSLYSVYCTLEMVQLELEMDKRCFSRCIAGSDFVEFPPK
jgi:hypothetical protein